MGLADFSGRGPEVDTDEEIRKALVDIKRQVVVQDELLGKPGPLLYVFAAITVVVDLVMMGYLLFLIKYIHNFGFLIPIPLVVILMITVTFIYVFYQSIGYRVSFTGKEIVVRQFNKERFRAKLSKLSYNFQEFSIFYKKLVLTNNENNNIFILTDMSFRDLKKVVDRLKKATKFFSLAKKR